MDSAKARFALLSVGAAVATLALKFTAYALTGSVGILSDALESLVNLAGALIALMALKIAARPLIKPTPTATTKLSTSPVASKGRSSSWQPRASPTRRSSACSSPSHWSSLDGDCS
jgi:hypothetical protein